MNDDHTLTVIKDRLAEVRDCLGEVYPSIPAGEIVARARRSHVRRRLIPGMAAVLALAVAAALAVTTLAPASHQASRHPQVQLAAWTVVTQPGGNVSVTIRELRDPGGLQSRLRADGVPATVTFLSQLNPACHPWPGAALHGRHTPAGDALFNEVFPPYPGPPGVIVIRPSALPSGGGVQLAAGFGGPGPRASIAIGAGLVQASPECTGS
ncbi:MAG TPA: hypothetical protein VN786_04380 [Acidimicrobiales bacterium]|nr:hypothetical protein [Acidimicrobiales bacterium]